MRGVGEHVVCFGGLGGVFDLVFDVVYVDVFHPRG